ncbi:site-specific integrase [Streptomyces sp. NBC_01763]|nr:tyrosine-type recombinase/integrase [Streptomyces sp. NBC_01763]WSC41008.1 site-specific integrase [Streptomyces sp. NBC_01763]
MTSVTETGDGQGAFDTEDTADEAVDSAVPGPRGAASLTRQAKYAPGAQVRVRDEQWLVKTVTPVGDEDWMVEATGVSSFVRGTDAVFYDKLDYIEALDPKKTLLVPDDSPNHRKEEESAFWDWATVETLRHSGTRIEEMCEVSHLSIRHYQRNNGEMVALLVISPSKTDRERVIPMSAELFHVIASIIRRHTQDGSPVPTLRRFDPHDKVWSPPMPFLFQRKIGSTRSVISPFTVLHVLARCCTNLAEHHPAFRSVKFTPHDFRRIFATELVNSGLPIHIGATLLGHLNIQTTRGYVAVFDEDVIRHYLTHLNERRQLRPDDEYGDVTREEWTEFEEHFDKRKVELGACGRPYGTPCQHEHACIRCPMLQVSPKMISRLDDLEKDLINRRTRAETAGRRGETEGIDLTLSLLRAKRNETTRRLRRPVVNLGIPLPRSTTTSQQITP